MPSTHNENTLSHNEKNQILTNLANPRMDWIIPPTLPGEWQEHTGNDAYDLLNFLGQTIKLGIEQVPITIALNLDRVRTRHLTCYGGALMVEAQGYDPEPGILGFIIHEMGITLLDGTSPPIHQLNKKLGLKPNNIDAVSDYFLLFMNWVHGEEGRFQPIIKGAAYEHRIISDNDKLKVNKFVKNELIMVHNNEFQNEYLSQHKGKMRYGAIMNVLYGQRVFECPIVMVDEGMLEMVADEALLEGINLHTEKIDGQMLRFRKELKEELS